MRSLGDWGPFGSKGSRINVGFLAIVIVLATNAYLTNGKPEIWWIVGLAVLEAIFIGVAVVVHRKKPAPPPSE